MACGSVAETETEVIFRGDRHHRSTNQSNQQSYYPMGII